MPALVALVPPDLFVLLYQQLTQQQNVCRKDNGYHHGLEVIVQNHRSPLVACPFHWCEVFDRRRKHNLTWSHAVGWHLTTSHSSSGVE